MTATDAPSSVAEPRWRAALPLFALLIIVAGIYAPVVGRSFIAWDDPDLVLDNPGVANPSWPATARFWTAPYFKLYTPLAYTLWSALSAAAGLNPHVFHLLNLLLHLASVALIFAIATRLGFSRLAALAAAGLFALHPLQVEPVAWVSGMNNLLAGAFSLAAIWLFFGRTRWHYALATVAFALALLSKPTAIVVPMLAAILVLGFDRPPVRQAAVRLAPWLIMAMVMAAVTRWAQPAVATAEVSRAGRIIVAGDALGFYCAKTLLPIRLTVDYGRTPAWLMQSPERMWTWMGGAAMVLGMIATARRWPRAMAGMGIFVFALLPVLGLTPFDFQKYSTVADRYAYLAMLGPALLLALAMERWSRRGHAFVCAVLAICAIASAMQIYTWRDSRSIFERNLRINPRSLAANRVLGFEAAQRGDSAEAMKRYSDAIRLHPDDFDAHYNLANLLLRLGDASAAAQQYRRALELRDAAAVRNNLGIALATAGDLAHAQRELLEAIRVDPAYAPAHASLGRVLLKQGKNSEASAAFRRALELDPALEVARRGLGEAEASPP